MTISEAITAVLSASHHGDQHFRSFLMCDEAAELRAALVALDDAARDEPEECYCHERDGSYVCAVCYNKGLRGHMQR